jgi:hypothetical protein
MTFVRTPTGLANMHLFLSVDYVVFVEGGSQTFSYADVCQGLAGTNSPDILYWQMIFKCIVPQKKVCFKPVGSKSTLKRIAKDIESGIPNVCVAMDQDFDRLDGSQILADGVLYTWGYSWENDLFHEVIIKETVFTLCPIDRTLNEVDIDVDISEAILKFVNDMRWFVRADVILSLIGSGLFDRANWKRYIKSASGKPYIDVQSLRTKIRLKRSSKTGFKFAGPSTKVNTVRDCFGHLLCTFLYRLLKYLLSEYSGPSSISLKDVKSLLIKIAEDQLNAGTLHELYSHHKKQFAFIPP